MWSSDILTLLGRWDSRTELDTVGLFYSSDSLMSCTLGECGPGLHSHSLASGSSSTNKLEIGFPEGAC